MLLSNKRSMILRDRVLYVTGNRTLQMAIEQGATMDPYNHFLYIFIPQGSTLTVTKAVGDTTHRVYGTPILGGPYSWDFAGPRMVNFMLIPVFQGWDIFFWFSAQ